MFSSGGQNVTIVNDKLDTYVQGTLGVSIASPGGVTGFIEGHGEASDNYRGGGGRAGIKIAF